MGNILSRINDDYDEYVELCESLKIKPKWITDEFYKHLKELTSMDKQDKTAEPVPHELAIVRNIWRRAYLDSEEDHVKILKEYGNTIAQHRTAELEAKIKALQERLEAADEVIQASRSIKLYATHGLIAEDYNKALEKYQSLKQ